MFRLERALNTYREAGSLNAQVNLFGFIDDHTFLTKSGDLGLVLAVSGVDFERLASAEVDNSIRSACNQPSKSSMRGASTSSSETRTKSSAFTTLSFTRNATTS